MRGIDASDALGFDDAEIWTMDADGGNQRRVLSIDTPAIGATWSPDGAWIAFSQVDGDRFGTYVVNVNTEELRPVGAGSFPEWLDQGTLIVEVP
jgi:Tol biopolymer transport system component